MSHLPPIVKSPPGWQLMRWIADPLDLQAECAQTYGDTFKLRLGNLGAFFVFGNPQGVKEIFSRDPSHFDVGRANTLAASLVGSNSLLLADGARHQRDRKLLMPPFHGERLQTYAHLIAQITRQIADRWRPGRVFVARTAMQQITLEVILQVVFGLREGQRYQALKSTLAGLLDLTDSPFRSSLLFFKFLQKDWGPLSPWGWFQRLKREIDALLQAEIDARRDQSDLHRQDILSLMLVARDEAGQGMGDQELKDEMITLLFAGHETTATTLAWALYEIHRHPTVKDKLCHELESFGDKADPIAIARLPYLTAVCQEVLRRYPVIPILFPRIVKVPMTLMGYDFEPEMLLAPSAYLVHYREDLYPDAHQFKPDRFLSRQYAPHEYFPFGGGNRRCLGYALAQLEMKLVVATVLSNYPLALNETASVKPQRRGFTLSPGGGVKMRLS
ncbi:MAG: cytochrome P450 [Cyanobacteria bacterium P01_F01_bin.4]